MRDAVRLSMGRAGSFEPPAAAAGALVGDMKEGGRCGTGTTLDEAVDTNAPGSSDPARCGSSECTHAPWPKVPNVATAFGMLALILSLVACSALMRGNC